MPERIVQKDWSTLDVRSDEVQEIISQPPNWLIRWGITAFFGVLIVILITAWAVKYPEIIQAPIKLTAINAPKTLNSRITGKLTKLLVENNVHVKKGEVLAWLESTASHKEVIQLTLEIDTMQEWLNKRELKHFKPAQLGRFANLGELQAGFQTFEQAYREFCSFLEGGFYSQKRQMIVRELQYTQSLLEQLEQQKAIQQQDFDLAHQEYEAQKQLAEEGIIAPLELKQEESKLLARRLPLEQTESSIINNYAAQVAKEKELMELDRKMSEQQSVFQQALNTLKSNVQQWAYQRLLVAPFEGKVIYTGILQENQTLITGQEVFYIQPTNSSYFGELSLLQNSFGKVEEGQKALVKFSGYPYQEFGSVLGKVTYISDIPVKDSIFLAKVQFENGLRTNYGKKLTPINGMRGNAEIITEDLRLIERFYQNIRKNLAP